MLTLYQFEISPFCDKVRRILNVKGVPYALREVTLQEAMQGRIKQVSPTGKLPALVADDRTIVDSTEIAHWLEAKYPEPRLIPVDPTRAALVHILEDWADESLYFYEMTMRLAWKQNAKQWLGPLTASDRGMFKSLAQRLAPRAVRAQSRAQGVGRKSPEQILKEVERHIRALGGLLGARDWLIGDRMSLADIAVYAQIACIGGTPEGQDLIQAEARVAAWAARVDQATSRRPQATAA